MSQISRKVLDAVSLHVMSMAKLHMCIQCGSLGLILVHGSWIRHLADKPQSIQGQTHLTVISRKKRTWKILCFYIKTVWKWKLMCYKISVFGRKKYTCHYRCEIQLNCILSIHNIKELSLTILPKPKKSLHANTSIFLWSWSKYSL